MITWGRIGLGVATVVAWQIAHLILGSEWLSSPIEIVQRTMEMAASGELAQHTVATMIEAALGFVVGGGLGIAIPFGLRLSPRLTAALDPYFAAAMGVPKLALAPLL